MDKRWQRVLDCLCVEHPPFSQGGLFNFRMRLIEHNLALLEHISPIEWDNVVLYGEYVLKPRVDPSILIP